MREQVEAALDLIRPVLHVDGGSVELVDVKGGVVSIRLNGACGSCQMPTVKLRNGIEYFIKSQVEGVVEVIAV